MSSLPVRSKPPLPPGAERRRAERFDLLAQVELEVDGDVLVLPVVNISAGGVLLRAEHGEATALTVDDRVTVHLDVSDLPQPITVTMDASVVRIVDNGSSPTIALMWTSTDAIAVLNLAELLQYLRSHQ
jgi:hypothetical protein